MAIWANEGKNVLVNYNYMLRVEGIYDLPCKAVHSFTKENEFEYVQEGGLNDYVHLLRKPVTKPFTFTVERYVGTDPYPPLPLGAELILPVILMVSPFPDRFDISKRTFVFTGCTVMSKTFGELNAEKSGLLTETIVIGYREMMEVTVPVHIGEDGSLWAFDGTKVEGKGKRSAETYDRPADDERPSQRYWRLNQTKGDVTEESNPSVDKRTNIASANTEEATAAIGRKWNIDGEKSIPSAKTLADTDPEQRYWSMTAPEAPAEGEETVEGAGEKSLRTWSASAKTLADTDPLQRQWKMASRKKPEGTGTRSASPAPETEAEARKWPAVSSAKKYTNVKKEEK